MSQKILLFGSNGMLGQAIQTVFRRKQGIDLASAARCGADFCFDFCDDRRLEECFNMARPDVIINCAAQVNLSLCETDRLSAYMINSRFVSLLSALCEKYGCYFIQISTDHYYTGDKSKAHSETEKITILNEYARTKFCGEQFALQHRDSLVVRTNIVGLRSKSGNPTFLEWAIRSLQQREKMQLFTDFYTSSIHTVQFAEILSDVLNRRITGLLNISASEVFSKKEFVLRLSEKLLGIMPEFVDASVRTLECRRAESLGLDCSKAEHLLGYKMPDLDCVLQSIADEYGRAA